MSAALSCSSADTACAACATAVARSVCVAFALAQRIDSLLGIPHGSSNRGESPGSKSSRRHTTGRILPDRPLAAIQFSDYAQAKVETTADGEQGVSPV